MKKNIRLPLRLLLLTVAALLCGLPRLHAGDLELVIAAKGQSFVQTNAAAPVINPEVSNRFSIFVLVQASSNSGLAGVIVSNAIIGMQSLEGEIGGLMFSHDESFSTKAELDSNVMSGTYVFHIAGTNGSNYVVTLTIPADAYPNAPHLANWGDAQHIDSFAAFTLRWDALVGGSASDFIMVSISDNSGGGGDNHVFRSPFIGEPGALTGQSNSVGIPAGTLLPGHSYGANITFVNVPNPTTNALTGALVGAGFFKETGINLITETNPPGGNIRFASTNLTVSEADGTVIVSVDRVGGSEGAVSVLLSTVGLTATAGLDFNTYSNRLSFEPGQSNRTVEITILNDFLLEGPERFRLGLSQPQGDATLTHETNAIVTITDNETAAAGKLSFSAATYQVVESNTTVNVIVRREGGTAGAVGGNIEILESSTATYEDDYESTPGLTMSFTIADGKNASTNVITILDDQLPEGNETIVMRLASLTGGATFGKIITNTTTILDDESTLQFEVARTTNIENKVEAKITVVRTGPTLVAASVDYSASVPEIGAFAPAIDANYATNGVDFLGTTGTLVFPPRVTKKTFTVKLIDDQSVEETEVIHLALSNPTSALLGGLTNAFLYIKDNDLGGTINFVMTNQNVKESVGDAKIMVIRTGGLASNVTVRLSTVAGTATDAADYVGFSSNLVFGAKEGKKTIPLRVIQDALVEPTENLTLILTDVSANATNGPRTNLTVHIADDDKGGTISFDKAAYLVNESVTNLAIIIKRTGGLASNVTVRLQSRDGLLGPPATAGDDYTAVDTVLTFGPGETRKTNHLHIINDDVADAALPETLILTLREFTGGARPGLSNSVVAITDDESSLSFESETSSGVENKTVKITVLRGGFLGSTSTVEYMFMDGTAINGSDFRGTNGTLIFLPKQTSKTITVPISRDTNAEPTHETFIIILKNAANALLGTLTTNTVSITDAPAVGAIPAAGASFLKLAIKGIEGNTFSDSISSGPSAPNLTLGNYDTTHGGGGFFPLNADSVVVSGRTVTSRNLQFTFLKFNSTGIIPVGADGPMAARSSPRS